VVNSNFKIRCAIDKYENIAGSPSPAGALWRPRSLNLKLMTKSFHQKELILRNSIQLGLTRRLHLGGNEGGIACLPSLVETQKFTIF